MVIPENQEKKKSPEQLVRELEDNINWFSFIVMASTIVAGAVYIKKKS